MKKLIIFSLIFSSYITFSQEIDSILSKKEIGNVKCRYIMKIGSKSTVKKFAMISFTNSAYSRIKDFGAIGLFDQPTLDQLISDLKKSISFLGTTGKNVSFKNESYILDILDGSKELYITDRKGKHTYLEKEDIESLIMWLSTVTI